MIEISTQAYREALNDFYSVRRKALLRTILARLKGKPTSLLSFDEIRQKLKLQPFGRTTLKDIPLASIVGSVNRFEDFTRDFIPRRGIDAQRWASVKSIAMAMEGLPPIEAYQIGETYFVSDGNHRVSVAREIGAKNIQAYVTEIPIRVPFKPEDNADELIIKAEYVEFLEKTQLDRLVPEADLSVSIPGSYQKLLEQVMIHHYQLVYEQGKDLSLSEATVEWYRTVYQPTLEILQERGMPREFPGRTDTDLFIWLTEYRASVEQQLADEVDIEKAVVQMASQRSPRPLRVLARVSKTITEVITPKTLSASSTIGEWRQQASPSRNADRLFSDLLVPISGSEQSWNALEQAFLVARLEGGARLHGLHVSRVGRNEQRGAKIQSTFNNRCQEAGASGRMALAEGKVTDQIIQRSAWNDLVVVNLSFPPGFSSFKRLLSGFRVLIQHCPCPILAVPHKVSVLKKALLAYDGSAKAKEALFIATYLVGKWQIPLVILTILNKRVTSQTLAEAKDYLDARQLPATFVEDRGPLVASILITAEEHNCDFIILGGYGRAGLAGFFQDNLVDKILRQSRKPMLLCR